MKTEAPGDDPALEGEVAGGNLYLARETCERFFQHARSVALIERDGLFLIVPLMSGSAGGVLLKVRNARGDRVIHAQEFIRTRGYREAFDTCRLVLTWRPELAALVVCNMPKAD